LGTALQPPARTAGIKARKGFLMEYLAPTLTLACILAFIGFGQWLRQQRRLMIHRERLAAIEKGCELPPVEQEAFRLSFNVQRLLLLFGLIWIAIGVAFFLVFTTMLSHPTEFTRDVPYGIQYVGVGMIGIGLSHLIAFLVGRNAA
jgi:hypothetical protein